MCLQGKDLLSIHQLTTQEVDAILQLALRLKDEQKKGIAHPILKGKTLGMIFQKASTRTRVSFEVGMWQLGGSALFLSSNDLQIGRGEPVRDTARVLSRYVDGIMIRTFAQETVAELAEYATVPVINGLTDQLHPCQALTDIFTAIEHKGTLRGRKLTYVGDGNNMLHSLMFACAKMGMNLSCACPDGYKPDPKYVELAQADAEETHCKIEVLTDPLEAAALADVLYTDVWASMGMEDQQSIRQEAMSDYQINNNLLAVARPDAIVMHCLPAHRGEEITNDVMEGPHSVIFDEAENRLHVQKAIMALLMSDENL